jgi:hypothetical protein
VFLFSKAEAHKRLTLSKSSQLIFKQFSASDLLLKDKEEVRKFILESKDSLGKTSEINEYSENYSMEKSKFFIMCLCYLKKKENCLSFEIEIINLFCVCVRAFVRLCALICSLDI